MSDPRRPDYQSRIIDEAADWFVRLEDTEVSPDDREAFVEWLRASPEHVREYLSLASMGRDLSEAGPSRSVDDLIAAARSAIHGNVIPLPARATARPTAVAATSARWQWWRKGVRYAAAALIAIFGVAFWVFSTDPNLAMYTTGIGEQKSFPLPDGSVVTLNAVSSLHVRYTSGFRDVQLVSGEALFAVAKNPARPFRVLSGDSVIRAIGTQFNVYHRQRADTTVTVVEGVVEIHKAKEGEPTLIPVPGRGGDVRLSGAKGGVLPVRVRRGERAHIGASASAIEVRNVDPAIDTAWRERRLIFDSRALVDAVAEFNLYNDVPIVIDAAALNGVQVSGSFSANDPRSFALFLGEAGLATPTLRDDRIVLGAPAHR